MRRRRIAVLLALACSACGNKDEERAPGPAAEAPAVTKARACADYQLDYWKKVADGSAEEPDLERYACAPVYSKKACPEAWTGSGAETAVALAKACAAAYCDALEEPKPALCRRGHDFDGGDLVEALVQLDAAILRHETGDRDLASQLAARMRLLRMPGPHAPEER